MAGQSSRNHLGIGVDYVSKIARAEKTEVNRIWQESSKWQKSVNRMLQDPWWDRAWVVQEAFLARHAVVQCGEHLIPFDDLCNFIIHPAIIGRLPGLKSFPVFNLAMTVQGVHNAVGDPSSECYLWHTGFANDSPQIQEIKYTRSWAS
jgi:hypothetical protein